MNLDIVLEYWKSVGEINKGLISQRAEVTVVFLEELQRLRKENDILHKELWKERMKQ